MTTLFTSLIGARTGSVRPLIARLSCHQSCTSDHGSHTKKPIKVLVTGAAGQIGYSILPRLARGDVWGCEQPVVLRMLDLPVTEKVMHGVRMELEDCSFKTLDKVEVYTDANAAFAGSDVVVMLANSMDLKADMTRAQLLQENLRVYKEKAKVLKNTCHENMKVLMIANPANTNCMLLIESLKGIISPSNLTCLTRLDHNRTRTMVAQKLGVSNDKVRKVTVWGNHSSTMYPDLRFAEVCTPTGWVKVTDAIKDKDWFQKVLVPTVRERAFAVISNRGKSSSLSAANAAIDHLRDWFNGTPADDWVSMGVYTDPIYDGIPKGVVFGQPCICKDGKFTVVKNLNIDAHTQQMFAVTAKELLAEREAVMGK